MCPHAGHRGEGDRLSGSPALSHPHEGPGGPGQIPSSPGLNHRDTGKSRIPSPVPPRSGSAWPSKGGGDQPGLKRRLGPGRRGPLHPQLPSSSEAQHSRPHLPPAPPLQAGKQAGRQDSRPCRQGVPWQRHPGPKCPSECQQGPCPSGTTCGTGTALCDWDPQEGLKDTAKGRRLVQNEFRKDAAVA